MEANSITILLGCFTQVFCPGVLPKCFAQLSPPRCFHFSKRSLVPIFAQGFGRRASNKPHATLLTKLIVCGMLPRLPGWPDPAPGIFGKRYCLPESGGFDT